MIWSSDGGGVAVSIFGRHLSGVAHLEHRHRDHEDDQQHQHHVDQRRDVDLAPDAPRIAHVHCHGLSSFGSATPPARRRRRLLLLGDQTDAAEAGLVDELHQAAHVLVLQAPVGLDHHVLVRGRGVDLGQRGLQVLLRHPVLVDEDRAVRLIAIVSCFGVLGHLRRGWPSPAESTSTPFCSIGVTTMKMISSTRQTSTRGVTLMSLRTSRTSVELVVL